MDRNRILPLSGLLCCVALRKESVDRNTNPGSTTLTFPGSLSARRAWIEITNYAACNVFCSVALRKESVDRNLPMCFIRRMPLTSLSARRAWIEILAYPDMIICTNGRSPQGERG